MKLKELINYWHKEVSNKKTIKSKIGLATNILKRKRNKDSLQFLFSFRLSQYLYSKKGLIRWYGLTLNRRINRKYATDIPISIKIGEGFKISHLPGIVITSHVEIGKNFTIRQNTTIGIKTLGLDRYKLLIGNNVSIGANSCIIADNLEIGNNVTIGAMSFVNKDITANSTFYNKR